jgi:hypothetical protein
MFAYYLVIATLCLAAPYAGAPPGVAHGLWPYTSGPFALTSVALGLAAHVRHDRGWTGTVIATLWGVGAVALSPYLSAPPLELERLLLAVQLQGAMAGLAAMGMFVAAFRVSRGTGKPRPRLAHTLALLALAVLLVRASLSGLGVLSTGGLEGLSRELGIRQWSLLGCGTVILLTLLGGRERPRGLHPTTEPRT